MTDWHLGMMTGFDLETTGTDPREARIVTASVVHVSGSNTQPPERYRYLADPGIEIPEEASKIHGITTERARAEGRPPVEVIEAVLAHLYHAEREDRPVVIMNARYDLTVMASEMRRHRVTERFPDLLVIDPGVIDREQEKFRAGGRKLTDLCQRYGVKIGEAHDSTEDALAACRVAWRLAQEYLPVRGRDLDALFLAQRRWAAGQALSLENYWRSGKSKGKSAFHDPYAAVEPEWPVLPQWPVRIRDGHLGMALCQSEKCRAPIRFVVTDKGGTMPIDAEPVTVGNIVELPTTDRPMVHVITKGEVIPEGTPRYVSHWATCADAERFREAKA